MSYTLKSGESITLPHSFEIGRVDQTLTSKERNSAFTVYLQNEGGITALQFSLGGRGREADNIFWRHLWTEVIFKSKAGLKANFPWLLLSSEWLPGEDVLILKHPEGVRIYKATQTGLVLLNEDENFHQVMRFETFLIGRFFPDSTEVGIMTRNLKGEVKFHVMDTKATNPLTSEEEDGNEIISELDKDIEVINSSEWRSRENKIFLIESSSTSSQARQMIALRSGSGMSFFRFNEDYDLERVFKTSKFPLMGNDDDIFFGNIVSPATGSASYKDVVQLFRGKIHLYTYTNVRKDYEKVAEISSSVNSKSLKIIDINNDSYEDVVFSGSDGLNALGWNSTSKSWSSLIQRSSLEGRQRFVDAVAMLKLPPAKLPFILYQDVETFDLGLSKITEKQEEVPTTTTRPTTTKRPTTTTRPTTTMATTRRFTSSVTTSRRPTSTTATTSSPSTSRILTCLKEVNIMNNEAKRLLWWADQFGFPGTILKKPVDVPTGQIKFSLPLISLQPLTGVDYELNLGYSSNQAQEGDLLGLGWQLSLVQDYVVVDHLGSILPSDFEYHLVMQGRPLKMKRLQIAEEDKNNVLPFELEKFPEMKVTYHRSDERWEVEGTQGKKTIYGGRSDALRKSFEFQNWRGAGKNVDGIRSYVVSWFLSEQQVSKFGETQKIEYIYQLEHTNAPGSSVGFTSEIWLSNIKERSNFEVEFHYGMKTNAEFEDTNISDKDGNIRAPHQLTMSKYLKGISVKTSAFKQKYEFDYDLKSDDKRILTRISENGKELIKMEYLHFDSLDRWIMSKAEASGGLKADFKLETVKPPKLEYKFEFPVPEKPQLTNGEDYSLLTFRRSDLDSLEIRMLSKGLTRETWRNSLSFKDFLEGDKKTRRHSAKVYSSTNFVVDLEGDEGHTLLSFSKLKEDWNTAPKLLGKYGKNSILTFAPNFILVSKAPGLLEIFSLEKEEWMGKEVALNNGKTISRMAVSRGLIVAYDDERLHLIKKIGSDFASPQEINLNELKGLSGRIRDTLGAFELEEEVRRDIIKSLDQGGLQLHGNAIALNSLSLENEELHGTVMAILLDDKLNVVSSKHLKIKRESITSLRYSYENDGSNYTMKFEKDGGIYKARLLKLEGKVLEDTKEVKNKNRRQDAVDNRIKSMNESENWLTFFKKLFFPTWELYSLQVNDLGVLYGNDTLLRPTSRGWRQDRSYMFESQRQVPLGKDYLIEVEDKSNSFNLFEGNSTSKLVRQFRPHSAGQIVNRFPSYIAQQYDNVTVEVVPFSTGLKRKINSSIMFQGERLSPAGSDWRHLATLKNSTDELLAHAQPWEFTIRPVETLIGEMETVHVSQLKITDGTSGRSRITGYERRTEFDKDLYIKTDIISRIPAGNKNISGWEEIRRILDLKFGTNKIKEKLFDNEGNEVWLGKESERSFERRDQRNSSSDGEKDPSHYRLLDASGNLLISDFTPYSLEEEMVNFYGFEDYEANQIGHGRNARWNTGNCEVIRGGFSMTGKNYLRVTGRNCTLDGEIDPKEKFFTTYIASAWIKVPNSNNLQVGNAFPYFKVVLKSLPKNDKIIGLQSTVSRSLEGWSYVEVPVNMQIAQQIVSNYTMARGGNGNFTLGIELTPPNDAAGEGFEVHVDHIKFHPVSYDFEATVYDKSNGRPTAILKSDGSFTRTIYDKVGKELASFRDDGSLIKLVTRSSSNVPASQTAFEPDSGFLEEFDCHGSQDRWEFEDGASWQTAKTQLRHTSTSKHIASLLSSAGDYNMFRFDLTLGSRNSKVTLKWKDVVVELQRNKSGEFAVMFEDNCIVTWLNGELSTSRQNIKRAMPSKERHILEVEVKGNVLIENFMALSSPQVTVDYFNGFGEMTQTLQFLSCGETLVTETIYDDLGREARVTKTTKVPLQDGRNPLAYQDNFVERATSLGNVQGLVSSLNEEDEGIPFTETIFTRDPSGRQASLGMPGRTFSAHGNYSTRLSYSNKDESLDPLLSSLFPPWEGYTQRGERRPNGSIKFSVFKPSIGDKEIARYIKVPGYNHLLSTYEYDEAGRLLREFSPKYHEEAGTFIQGTPWNPPSSNSTAPINYVSIFEYDQRGQLTSKSSDDTGTTQYLYNSAGLLRFMVFADGEVVYFDYDDRGQMTTSGYLKEPSLSVEELRRVIDVRYVPFKVEHQLLQYNDDHPNPTQRFKIKSIVTKGEESDSFIEKVTYDKGEKIAEKSAVLSVPDFQGNDMFTLKREFNRAGRLEKLIYGDLELIHKYNRVGQLISVTDRRNGIQDPFIFSWKATGQLESEIYGNFTRNFQYNSPGFLKKISDPFLTENISYLKDGYGIPKFGMSGDGLITRTNFKPSWVDMADPKWFQVNEDEVDPKCLDALKDEGYVSKSGIPLLATVGLSSYKLPLFCDIYKINKLLSAKMKTKYYGHRYSYGSHQELIRAKYFSSVENESVISEPLSVHLLGNDLGVDMEEAKNLWRVLNSAKYIISDQHTFTDMEMAIGKERNSIVRSEELFQDLLKTNETMTLYWKPIEALMLEQVGNNMTNSQFNTHFLKWKGLDRRFSPRQEVNRQLRTASTLWNLLQSGQYFEKPFDSKFNQISKSAGPEVLARILARSFKRTIGSSPFDVESFGIDQNGNHKLFYEGQERVELVYGKGNQVLAVKKGENETEYAVVHDKRGNIVQAGHKGISRIKYHPVSQRPLRIELNDGRFLRFWYDAIGERILKRVYSPEGTVISELAYLRDENGRVLLDKHTNFGSGVKITRTYIYGPRGLLGFLRDGKFYSVATDHQGSTRLIIGQGNVVVAAYDYMPYGKLMRKFGAVGDGIPYLYNGMEWDEETGLYNFHARLYDPEIGRFLQPDPKGQYFSPYKYAGNSPLSVVDPDGELAFLLTCLILAAVGAYLGGAAANNRWNPLDWDFEDSGTWLGIGGGAIAGGFLPVGFGASAAFIGGGTATFGSILATTALGVGGLYLQGAAVNQNWNFVAWKWDRPETWSAMFQGFGAGSGIAGSIGVAQNFAQTSKALTAISNFFGVSRDSVKVAFLVTTYSAGVAVAYVREAQVNNGSYAFWEWDFTNPALYSSLIDGFDSGSGWPQNFLGMGRGFQKLISNPSRLLKTVGEVAEGTTKGSGFLRILRNPSHPLWKSSLAVVMGYFMGVSANNGELDIAKWNLNSFSTYEGILNGIFMGKDFHNLRKLAEGGAQEKPPPGVDELKTQISTGFSERMKDYSGKLLKLLEGIVFGKKIPDLDRIIANAFDSVGDRALLIDKVPDDDGRQKLQTFFDDGPERWKNGENNPPVELQKALVTDGGLDNRIFDFEAEQENLMKKKQEIIVDQDDVGDLDFLPSCSASKLRRRKRGLKGSAPCNIKAKAELKYEDERDLAWRMMTMDANPENFFRQNAISFNYDPEINSYLGHAGKGSIPSNDANGNPIPYSFSLKPTDLDNPVESRAYTLIPTALADPSSSSGPVFANAEGMAEVKNQMKSYWLNTEDVIKFDPNGDIRYVLTSQLAGCSILIGRTPDGEMVLYHHYRHFKYDNPDPYIAAIESYVKKFGESTDIAWKQVVPFEFYKQDVGDFAYTGILHKDVNNNWKFISQTIDYQDIIGMKFRPLGEPRVASVNVDFDTTPKRNRPPGGRRRKRSTGERIIRPKNLNDTKFQWVIPSNISSSSLYNSLDSESSDFYENGGGGKSWLEFGDDWLSGGDFNGILTWANVFIKKWMPSSRSKPSVEYYGHNFEMGNSIFASTMVEAFMEIIEPFPGKRGEDINSYCCALKEVKKIIQKESSRHSDLNSKVYHFLECYFLTEDNGKFPPDLRRDELLEKFSEKLVTLEADNVGALKRLGNSCYHKMENGNWTENNLSSCPKLKYNDLENLESCFRKNYVMELE